LDRIVALDDKKEVVSYEQESKTYIASWTGCNEGKYYRGRNNLQYH
jgi:hypothetical protein